MVAEAETKPQVLIRYHTVPDGHVDDFALSLLADILGDRTGRLFKALVLESQVANDVSVEQQGFRYEGMFQIRGVAKPGSTPEAVEKGVDAEIEKLQKDLVSDRELQKVKNQWAASNFRQLRSNFSLLLQLLLRDAYRGWSSINADPPRVQAVTAEDIRRVAQKYLRKDGKTVLVFNTKAPATDAPAEKEAAGR